jgi:hypothetical protein
MLCSNCNKPIEGAVFLLPNQNGAWCSVECRLAQIIPFEPLEPVKKLLQEILQWEN